jgi:mycothiol synthase
LPADLAITPVAAETRADLEALIEVRRRATPEDRPTVENLRFNLESMKKVVYLLARLGGEPVACGFVDSWPEFAMGDAAVVPEHRRQGIGSAMLAEVSARAHDFGNNRLQVEVRDVDAESRVFLERRGFVKIGAEQAVVFELEDVEPPGVAPPPGVRIVSRAEEPDLLDQMYLVGVQAGEDIPGSEGVPTFEQWKAHEIDRPTRRPELCFIALTEHEVVGYAALQVFGDEAHHGLTATRRDWRRKGVASALKRAEIAAAKRAGFRRLVTESEERNEPMQRLNEKLGFIPSPELSVVVMRGHLV